MASLSTLRVRIKTNRLLGETNDIVFSNSANSIIDAIGGLKCMLFKLTKSLNIQQLTTINNIISTEQRKFKTQISNNNAMEINNDNDNDHDTDMDSLGETNNNSFQYLPNECLSYICSYLDKSNIKSFKLTSRQICISCLEEMQKISISTLNINNPFDKNNDNDFHNLRRLHQHFKIDRHCKTKRFYSLFEQWELKYNIPEQYQLIFQCDTPSSLSIIASQTVRLTRIPSIASKYLITDKRNVIIWAVDKPRIFDASDNSSITDYQPMILEYFDVYNQTFYIVQIILYKPNNKPTYDSLSKYIEHDIILLNGYGINNVWYTKFKSNINKITNKPKICMYGHGGLGFATMYKLFQRGHNVISNCNRITFQLNETDSVYPNAVHFTDKIGVHIRCYNNISDLQTCIDNYNKTINNEKNKINVDFSKPYLIKNMSSYSIFPRIKHKISKYVFHSIVDPKCIQIVNASKYNFVKSSLIRYTINLCDANETDNDKEHIIRIFSPSNSPYPYYSNTFTVLNIKYKSEIIIKDFIHYICQIIKNNKNSLLYHQFKPLIPLLNDIDANENNFILCPRTKFDESNYQYVTPYNLNEKCRLKFRGKKFDLFLYNYKVINDNQNNNVPLQIRFISDSYISAPCDASQPLYQPQQYISRLELLSLKINDQIYHRDFEGGWWLARIINKKDNKIQIHYNGFENKYDIWCDITTDILRFGNSDIHPYKTHSVINVNGYKVGEHIYFNKSWSDKIKGSWRRGKIRKIGSDGIVKLSVNKSKYFVHVDDTNEIRKYKPLNCQTYSKYNQIEMIKHKHNPNGIQIRNTFKRFIGLPLDILINKNHCLEYIINKYLSYSKDCITNIYKVSVDDTQNKLISISKDKRNSFKPYHEFSNEYKNNFLLIEIELKKSAKNLGVTIFPKTIIGGEELTCSNKKEMEIIIKLIFDDKYSENNLSGKIAKRVIDSYDGKNFAWNDIVNDFSNGFNKNNCFAVQYVIEIFGEYNVDFDQESVWNLLKRCKPV